MNKNPKTSVKSIYILLFVALIVGCDSNNTQAQKGNTILKSYSNHDVSFSYPSDYSMKEEPYQGGNCTRVHLGKKDGREFRMVDIVWDETPSSNTSIGRHESLRNNYTGKAKVIKDYETELNGETVYWTDFCGTFGSDKLYISVGSTEIDGWLFCFITMSSNDEHLDVFESIFSSIRITGDKASYYSMSEDSFVERAKILNKQCPLQPDECTIFKSVIASGHTLIINTQIDDLCDDFVDLDEFKRLMIGNWSTAIDKRFIKAMDKDGYGFVYLIYNEKNVLKRKVQITPAEILANYE